MYYTSVLSKNMPWSLGCYVSIFLPCLSQVFWACAALGLGLSLIGTWLESNQ